MLKFLIGGFHPDIDLDMVIGLWFIHSLNFCSLSWFQRCKDHLCPFKTWFGALEDAGGSWLGLCILILIRIWSLVFDKGTLIHDFGCFILKSGSPNSKYWRMLEVPDWGLVSWSWFRYSRFSLIHPWSNFGSLTWFLWCKEHLCH